MLLPEANLLPALPPEWTWSELWLLFEWLVRLIMLPVVVTRKTKPTACLAWLTFIFFIPVVGLLAYLLIGENRLGRSRIERHARHADDLQAAVRPEFPPEHMVRPQVAPHQEALVRVAEKLCGLPILGGNAVELFGEADAVIERLVADIDRAEHHVHLLFYIFSEDAVGRQVADALARAAARGVRCRLLVDAVGSRHMLRRLAPDLRRRGVQVAAMLPASLIRRRFARLDLRNHRKLAVIDGAVAYAGSQNIIHPNYGQRRFGPWQDLMARIAGPSVNQLQAIFGQDWAFVTGEEPADAAPLLPAPTRGDASLQAVPSGPNYATTMLQDLVIEALHTAQQRVIITTPYFVPDDAWLAALRLAALRGVQIDLVVPARTNHPLVDIAGHFYFTQLLEMGVRIHMHQRGLLHAKTLTADEDFAILGSANFDIRSFYLNFELNLLLYDPAVTAQLRAYQERYMAESSEVTLPAWRRRPGPRRLAENCAKLLSPLL